MKQSEITTRVMKVVVLPSSQVRLLQRAKSALVQVESSWFDFRWGVRTSATSGSAIQGGGPHLHAYLPTRPFVGLQILRQLPITNFEEYTFVDYGSGKGRMLILAAQFPFRAVHGVEYDRLLHEESVRNVAAIRHAKKARAEILCHHLDARDFEVPLGCLVLYLFNPFAGPVLNAVLQRLRDSLEQSPRHVFLVSLYVETEAICTTVPQLRLWRQDGRVSIYETAL